MWWKNVVLNTSKDLKDMMMRSREDKNSIVTDEKPNDCIKMLSLMVIKFVDVFLGLLLTVFTDSSQCWCWTDRLLYRDRYHVRYGRKRRCCGYLQLCQGFTVPAHQHGTNWGTAVCLWGTWCFLKSMILGQNFTVTLKTAGSGPVEGVSPLGTIPQCKSTQNQGGATNLRALVVCTETSACLTW